MKGFLKILTGLAIFQFASAGPLSTSFVNLLVYPNELDGKEVHVYVYVGSSGSEIFLTKDHAMGHDLLSSINLYHPHELPATKVLNGCIDKYVYVTGVFNKDTEAKMAGISKITRIRLPSGESCGLYK